MKNLYKYLVVMTVSAISLFSCTKEVSINDSNEDAVTIKVHATAQNLANPDTKTYIDSYTDPTTYEVYANTILWGTGEYMNLCVTSVANETTENKWATSKDGSADLFDGEPDALFEFGITPQTASSYKYQGLYPASSAVTSSNTDPTNYKVNLPSIQNATSISYDPAGYIMVAKPENFDKVQTDWTASFRRATALNKITLKAIPDGVSIKKVKITAPSGKYLAGGRYINLSNGESGDIYANGGRTETIEVKYSTALTGTSADVWFTSWGVEVAEGETLTIVAYTSDKKTYTKIITVPTDKSIEFKEGYLNTLGVTLSGVVSKGPGWEETDLADITSGDVFVIVGNNGSNYALSNDNGTSNPPTAVSVTISDDKITGDVADYIKWNISCNATDGYTFYPNGSTTTWLYCTNTNNGVRVGTGNAKHFTISNNGYLTTGETTDRRYLGIYNSTDWRCYTSEGGNIANQTFSFYKYYDGGLEKLVMGDVSCTDSGESENSLSFSWDDVDHATGYKISIDGINYSEMQTTRTYTLTDLSAGTTHTIWVKAVGDDIDYLDSDAVSASGTTKSSGEEGYTAVDPYTFVFSEIYDSNTTLDGDSIEGTNCSIEFNKGGTATQYYKNGSAVRWYGGGTLQVTAAAGYKITKIKINFSRTDNAVSADIGDYSDGTWTGKVTNGDSVTFTQAGTSGQCRITSIEINKN